MKIGTAEGNSTFESQGFALTSVLDTAGLANVTILNSVSASIENAKRLDAGELDFGFMAANWLGLARTGQAPFSTPIDLRMVAPMNAGPMYFIARADSDIHTVLDLRGKRVAIGLQTSGVAQHARSIFTALGISHADFTPIYLDFADGAEALARGDVDAQLQCPIPNNVMTALDERIALRVLPYPQGALQTVLDARTIYRPTTMRAGSLRALTQDIEQAAVVNVLVTHARVPAALVEFVTHAIYAGRNELPKLNKLFLGMGELFEPLRTQGASALQFDGVGLHDGAISAYRKAGLLA